MMTPVYEGKEDMFPLIPHSEDDCVIHRSANKSRRREITSRCRGASVSRTTFLFCSTLIGLTTLVCGLIIGYFNWGGASRCSSSDTISQQFQSKYGGITEMLSMEIHAENIKAFLKEWSANPHLAGTEREKSNAVKLVDLWKSQGLEDVVLKTYSVLLSYPDEQQPSSVTIIDDESKVLFESQRFEKPLSSEQNRSDIVPPYLAYAKTGDVAGDIIYVNYCSESDFEYASVKLLIDPAHKIALCRYGSIFRADKVRNAANNKCAGVIIYSDPADYALNGESDVYPQSWWLPSTGVQRGTLLEPFGDPLTPFWPANEWAFRRDESDAVLPEIPAHAISYGDARQLLQRMQGKPAPQDWQGGLNITYKMGPGFGEKTKVRLNVHNRNVVTPVHNVIGIIRGRVEPDRYVILGNHRDAWVFGALDPTSGTAVLAELVRVFGQMVEGGWRPRRTIIFCSWAAEEFGLLGSTEWVEEFGKLLQDRAVAYLNVDMAVTGNYSLHALGVPLLRQALFDAANRVPNPHNRSQSVFDHWAVSFPDPSLPGKPLVEGLGSGSDFGAFIHRVGVPSVDLRYKYDSQHLKLPSHPLYHSAYSTFDTVQRFIDPDFQLHVTLGRVWAELALNLSESMLLPLSPLDYAEDLEKNFNLLTVKYGDKMKLHQVPTDGLLHAIKNLTTVAKEFEERMRKVNVHSELAVRQVNDVLMQMERAFIVPRGLDESPMYSHILFAPSAHDAYKADPFPALSDALYETDQNSDTETWKNVNKQLAGLVASVRSAHSVLSDSSFE